MTNNKSNNLAQHIVVDLCHAKGIPRIITNAKCRRPPTLITFSSVYVYVHLVVVGWPHTFDSVCKPRTIQHTFDSEYSRECSTELDSVHKSAESQLCVYVCTIFMHAVNVCQCSVLRPYNIGTNIKIRCTTAERTIVLINYVIRALYVWRFRTEIYARNSRTERQWHTHTHRPRHTVELLFSLDLNKLSASRPVDVVFRCSLSSPSEVRFQVSPPLENVYRLSRSNITNTCTHIHYGWSPLRPAGHNIRYTYTHSRIRTARMPRRTTCSTL